MFFKANKEVSEKIIQAFKDWKKILNEGKRIQKEYGATDIYYSATTTSFWFITGFKFNLVPDNKIWSKVRNTVIYKPKYRTPLRKKFDSLKLDVSKTICEALQIKNFHYLGNLRFGGSPIRYKCLNGIIYFETEYDCKPKGCRQISDITFNKVKGEIW